MSDTYEDRFTKQVVERYEEIRASGVTNMLDMQAVKAIARKKGYEDLAAIASNNSDYGMLLMSYNKLLEKYGIEQSGRSAF